jgi:hypothetical protein
VRRSGGGTEPESQVFDVLHPVMIGARYLLCGVLALLERHVAVLGAMDDQRRGRDALKRALAAGLKGVVVRAGRAVWVGEVVVSNRALNNARACGCRKM